MVKNEGACNKCGKIINMQQINRHQKTKSCKLRALKNNRLSEAEIKYELLTDEINSLKKDYFQLKEIMRKLMKKINFE